jgi:hypothetical protein
MKYSTRNISLLGACAAAALTACTTSANADVTSILIEKSVHYQQTGPTTATLTGAQFFAAVGFIGAPDLPYTLTYPGPASPQAFNLSTETAASFATQAELDAAYPAGSYTVKGSATTNETVNVQDMYPDAIPTLTAASFEALAHATAGPMTIYFNSFTPSPFATTSEIQFIVGLDTSTLCTLAPSATSCTIDLSGLPPGPEQWSLGFTNEAAGVEADGVPTEVIYGYGTSGIANIGGVPEASTWSLLIAGFAGLGAIAYRQRKQLVLTNI